VGCIGADKRNNGPGHQRSNFVGFLNDANHQSTDSQAA
jgi:hypothetical protein